MDNEQKKYILRHGKDKTARQLADDLHLKERKIKKFLEKEGRRRPEAAPAPPGERFSRRRIALSLLCIAAAGFFAYGNALTGKFLWDDESLIIDNPLIKSPSGAVEIFSGSIGKGSGEKYTAYRPFQMLTYAADYAVWRLKPFGYHLTSLGFHILAAFGLYGFIRVLWQDDLLSFLAAMFFAVHPVQAPAVSYISGRADPLAAVFLFLTLIFYLRAPRGNPMGPYLAMMGAAAAALLSRESSIVLPLLAGLTHLVSRQRIRRVEFFSLIVLCAGYGILRVTVFKGLLVDESSTTHFFQRLPGFFAAVGAYLRVLVIPAGLHMEYGQRLFSPFDSRVILGFVVVVLSALAAWRQRRRHRLSTFAIAWFFAALLPVSNLFPLNAYMAEHWLYVPSLAFFLLLSAALKWGMEKAGMRPYAWALGVGLLVLYSGLTIRQNHYYWKEPRAFFERTLAYAPESVRILRNLSGIYEDERRYPEALALLLKAAAIKPEDPEIHKDLAILYEKTGSAEEAQDHYRKAIVFYEKELIDKPDSPTMVNNLGFAYQKTGQFERAQAAFKKAVELNPYYTDALNNLAATTQASGATAEMIEFQKKIVALNPDKPEATNNLGMLYQRSGQADEAERMFKKAVELDPQYAQAYNNLGVLYKQSGRVPEAVASYQKAIAIDPRQEDALYNLGVVYLTGGDYEQAILSFRKALEVNPGNAVAYHNLGAAYQSTGKPKEAAAAYEKSIGIDPESPGTYLNLGLAYQGMGRTDEALAAFRKAYETGSAREQDRNFAAAACQNLALIYFQKKQYDQAVRYCDEGRKAGASFDEAFLKALEPYRGVRAQKE